MHRLHLLLILAACFLTAAFSPERVSAGTVSAELQSLVAASSASSELAVIIALSDKEDLTLIREKDKRTKRRKIVESLRARAERSQAPLRALLRTLGAKKVKPLWAINAVAATIPADAASRIAALPGVEEIRLDAEVPLQIYSAAAPASVPAQWNITMINVEPLWAAGFTGQGVTVANMDTGVDVTHPELSGNYRGGTNSWYDPFYSTLSPSDNAPLLETGHGTGTMSVMAAGSLSSTAIGVAPGVRWIAAKIYDLSIPTPPESVIHDAFGWLLDPDKDPQTDDAPDVVNASWGINNPNSCDLRYAPDIDNLRAAGIAVVFSAGNSGPGPAKSISPANNPGVFSVGALAWQSSTIYYKSSRGPSACDGSIFPRVMAPGESIETAKVSGGYQNWSGTSFSAPHAAGAMAVMLSIFPSLTPLEMETALEQTAVPLPSAGASPNNDYGYGLIDVSAATGYLLTHGYIALPGIAGYPASRDFGNIDIPGPSITRTFTITSHDTQDMLINSLLLTGADSASFSIPAADDTCTGALLTPLSSCTFVVVFSPLSTGPINAAVSVSYGGLPATYDIPLSANATGPVALVRGESTVKTYLEVTSAYTDCIADDLLRLRQGVLIVDNPDFNPPSEISISLMGGYDVVTGMSGGYSTIQGFLRVSRGALSIEGIIIR